MLYVQYMFRAQNIYTYDWACSGAQVCDPFCILLLQGYIRFIC